MCTVVERFVKCHEHHNLFAQIIQHLTNENDSIKSAIKINHSVDIQSMEKDVSALAL